MAWARRDYGFNFVLPRLRALPCAKLMMLLRSCCYRHFWPDVALFTHHFATRGHAENDAIPDDSPHRLRSFKIYRYRFLGIY